MSGARAPESHSAGMENDNSGEFSEVELSAADLKRNRTSRACLEHVFSVRNKLRFSWEWCFRDQHRPYANILQGQRKRGQKTGPRTEGLRATELFTRLALRQSLGAVPLQTQFGQMPSFLGIGILRKFLRGPICCRKPHAKACATRTNTYGYCLLAIRA